MISMEDAQDLTAGHHHEHGHPQAPATGNRESAQWRTKSKGSTSGSDSSNEGSGAYHQLMGTMLSPPSTPEDTSSNIGRRLCRPSPKCSWDPIPKVARVRLGLPASLTHCLSRQGGFKDWLANVKRWRI